MYAFFIIYGHIVVYYCNTIVPVTYNETQNQTQNQNQTFSICMYVYVRSVE